MLCSWSLGGRHFQSKFNIPEIQMDVCGSVKVSCYCWSHGQTKTNRALIDSEHFPTCPKPPFATNMKKRTVSAPIILFKWNACSHKLCSWEGAHDGKPEMFVLKRLFPELPLPPVLNSGCFTILTSSSYNLDLLYVCFEFKTNLRPKPLDSAQETTQEVTELKCNLSWEVSGVQSGPQPLATSSYWKTCSATSRVSGCQKMNAHINSSNSNGASGCFPLRNSQDWKWKLLFSLTWAAPRWLPLAVYVQTFIMLCSPALAASHF